MQQQTRAYGFALTAVLLWSTVASAFKLALRVLSPAQLLLYASLVATLALVLVLAGQGRLAYLRVSRRDLARSALLGFLNPYLYYAVLFEAYARLPGQEAQPLNYTWAIALAILSVPLLGQRIRAGGFAAILVSFAGVYVIATRGDLLGMRFGDPLGVALAVGSSLIWALFWILNLRDGRDPVAKLCLSFGFGCLFTLLHVLARGQWVVPGGAGLAGAAYAGLFEMGLTFVVWLEALRRSRTTAQVANLIFLSPFVSLVLLHYVAGETIHPSSVAGLALIVAGIMLQKRFG